MLRAPVPSCLMKSPPWIMKPLMICRAAGSVRSLRARAVGLARRAGRRGASPCGKDSPCSPRGAHFSCGNAPAGDQRRAGAGDGRGRRRRGGPPELPGAKLPKVLRRARAYVCEELHLYPPRGLPPDSHICGRSGHRLRPGTAVVGALQSGRWPHRKTPLDFPGWEAEDAIAAPPCCNVILSAIGHDPKVKGAGGGCGRQFVGANVRMCTIE